MKVALFVPSLLCFAAVSYAGASLPCRYAGVFPHPTDCASMYTCHGSPKTGFKTEVYSCPRGQAFSKKTGRCMDSDLVPDCVQPLASDPMCQNATLHCADCYTLVFCELNGNGEFVNPTVLSCAEQNPDLPYCDSQTKSCTDILPSDCKQPGYKCTAPGFFPDPNSCDTYHICKDVANEDDYLSKRCAEGSDLFYDSKKFECSSVDPGACGLNCSGIIGILPHPIDDRYYVFCRPVQDSELLLYACPGNFRFDVSECKFNCNERDGLYAHIDDCTKFHRCENLSESIEDQCPDPLAFNPISGACEAKDNVRCPQFSTLAPTTTAKISTNKR